MHELRWNWTCAHMLLQVCILVEYFLVELLQVLELITEEEQLWGIRRSVSSRSRPRMEEHRDGAEWDGDDSE